MSRDPLLPRAVRSLRQTLAADRLATPDAALLTRFRDDHDADAFEAIVRRHGPGVLSASRKVLTDDADIEDVFQAAFVVLFRRANSIRKGQSVGAWLYGVAHRLALRARAARRRREFVEGRSPQRPPSPGADLTWQEAVAILHEELDRLPDKYRHPLMLCYLEGLSRDEAAARLGVTLNVVRNRLERGRTQLRTRLGRRGVTLSAGLLGGLAGSAGFGVPPSLVHSAVAALTRPSARVASLVGSAARLSAMKLTGGMALAAALLIGITIGDGRLRAGPSKKDTPTKDSPAKVEAKQDVPKADAPENLAVKGRVVDPDGKPVNGAKIWLLLEPWAIKRTAGAPQSLATTDADGSFDFAVDGKGRRRYWSEGAQVIATADRFGLAWTGIQDLKDKPLELKLVKDEPIAGRILDLQGKPIQGAKVRILEVTAANKDDLSAWLDEVKAKKQPLHAIHNNHFSHEGRLFLNPYAAPGQQASFTTDADGKFRIAGLGRERKITLRIEGPTIATTEETVLTRVMPILTVPEDPGDSLYGTQTFHGATFDLVANPTQPFEGTVTDRITGKPVVGVTVRAAIKWFETSSVTDKDGKYRLSGLAPSVHELIACPTAEQPYHRMAVKGGLKASTNTATVDFALTTGHWVTGKVIDVRNQKPMVGAPVWYFPFADEDAYKSVPGSRAWVQDAATFTAEDGTFRVLAYPCRGAILANGNGRYIGADQRPLQGDTDSWKPARAEDHFLPTSPAAYLGSYHAAAIINVEPMKPKSYTIAVDPGATVTVKLTDTDGKPVDGVGVGGQSTWALWTPDQKAEMTISEYSPDRPRSLLFLQPKRGLGKLIEPKKGDTGPWTVTLEPTGTVSGRLITEDGKGIANAVLQFYYRLPGQNAWTPSMLHEVRTDDKGAFRITNLVAGVTYSARHSEDRDGKRQRHFIPIQVKSGEAKDLGDVKPAGGN